MELNPLIGERELVDVIKEEESPVLILKAMQVNNFNNTPSGIRIRVASVKGMCPRPLDDGGVTDFI